MKSLPTASPALKLNFGPRPPAPPSPPPERRRWPKRYWLLFIALVFVAHVALVFIFGEDTFPPPREVKNVPHLQSVNDASERVALDDPTLFALPRAGDFARLETPRLKAPDFRWTEEPRLLSLPGGMLGAAYNRFVQTNAFAVYEPDFKPQPKLNVPMVPIHPAFAEHSLLQIEGDLAQRRLVDEMVLPDLAYADVIGPSRVQVLISASGDAVSAVLLESSGWSVADQRALELARAARFVPAPHLTIGWMIFNWHTVAPPPAETTPASR